MRTRDAVLVYNETQTPDASTKIIDLDIVDPISALVFEFAARNGTSFNQNNPLSRCVTKIEIVDGSEVISSLSMEQLQALEWYKTGKQPTIRETENLSEYPVCGGTLLFGRYLWDKEYALDTGRYTNPQLKITWNLAAVKAVSATEAYRTGSFVISVTAKIMEQVGVVPAKILAAKEIQSWTSLTEGDRRIDLPVDYPLRFLMLRAYVEGSDTNECITNIKITCDTDAYIMMNRKAKDHRTEMGRLFGALKLNKRVFATTADTPWLATQDEPTVALTPAISDVIPSISYVYSGRFYLNLWDYDNVVIATDHVIIANYWGIGLWATIPIPMGIGNEPDTWFDPTVYRKFEAVLTEAVAAACSITVEQVK